MTTTKAKKKPAKQSSFMIEPRLITLAIVALLVLTITPWAAGSYHARRDIRLAQSAPNKACAWLDRTKVEKTYGITATTRTGNRTELVQQSTTAAKPLAHQTCEYLLAQPNASGEESVAVETWFFAGSDGAAQYARMDVQPRRHWTTENATPGDVKAINWSLVVGGGGTGRPQYLAFYTVVNSVAVQGRIPCSNATSNATDIEGCIKAGVSLAQSLRKQATADTQPNPFL